MVGSVFYAVDQGVVPGAARSNVAGVAGAGLRRRWLWPFFYKKISVTTLGNRPHRELR